MGCKYIAAIHRRCQKKAGLKVGPALWCGYNLFSMILCLPAAASNLNLGFNVLGSYLAENARYL